MNPDIVEQLRHRAKWDIIASSSFDPQMCIDAADEIERLRSEIVRYRVLIDGWADADDDLERLRDDLERLRSEIERLRGECLRLASFLMSEYVWVHEHIVSDVDKALEAYVGRSHDASSESSAAAEHS